MAEPFRDKPLPDERIGGDDADLIATARERYQKAVDHDRDNRDEGRADLEFLANINVWPEEIRAEREEDGRPILSNNHLLKFVHQVTGDIRQNKPGIKVRPADDIADDKVADIYTGLIRHIEADSDAGTVYYTAAQGAAQCGIGHFGIYTTYSTEDTFDQDIKLRLIPDPFAVTWDPQAVHPTRCDARFCFVESTLDIKTFRARYPNASTAGFDFQDGDGRSIYGDWLTHETVRVAEYWTKEPEKRTLALLEDGRTIDVTDMQSVEVTDEAGRTGKVWIGEDGEPLIPIRTRTVYRDKVQMRIISGAEVLEGPFDFPVPYIPIVPVIGEEIHIGPKTVRHGVIRFAKDAQRMVNYWESALTEYIALQPKVPWLVTAKNIENYENIWKQANDRNLPYLPWNPDADNGGTPPQRNAPQMGSPAMIEGIRLAHDNLHGTTGIFPPALGQKSNETSGVAIMQRQRESDTGTFAYADNLARAIRYAGRILVALIPKIYDTERQIRILNEDESTKPIKINQRIQQPDGTMATVNDLSLGKYDVVVTTGPSYSTKRQEAATWMTEWVRNDPQGAALIRDILFKNLDLPGADEASERFRKALPPGLAEPREGEEPAPPAPPTPEQQAAQAEAEAKQKEAARKALESAAKAEKTQAETEGQRLENMQKELEIAMATGQMQQVIEQQVAVALAKMLSGGQDNGGDDGTGGTAPPIAA